MNPIYYNILSWKSENDNCVSFTWQLIDGRRGEEAAASRYLWYSGSRSLDVEMIATECGLSIIRNGVKNVLKTSLIRERISFTTGRSLVMCSGISIFGFFWWARTWYFPDSGFSCDELLLAKNFRFARLSERKPRNDNEYWRWLKWRMHITYCAAIFLSLSAPVPNHYDCLVSSVASHFVCILNNRH